MHIQPKMTNKNRTILTKNLLLETLKQEVFENMHKIS
jgi:hypothetical protein